MIQYTVQEITLVKLFNLCNRFIKLPERVLRVQWPGFRPNMRDLLIKLFNLQLELKLLYELQFNFFFATSEGVS